MSVDLPPGDTGSWYTGRERGTGGTPVEKTPPTAGPDTRDAVGTWVGGRERKEREIERGSKEREGERKRTKEREKGR